MVVATPTQIHIEKIREVELPIIDLSAERSEVSKLIVKACSEFGFFKVINHGVPEDVITRMEEESYGFFAKPGCEKQRAGPVNPYGYGSKNIGFNGDVGEVEYLLLSTNFVSISQRSKTISNDPLKFSCAVRGYIEAVRGLACELLDLMAKGLGLWVSSDTSSSSSSALDSASSSSSSSVFSQLIRDVDNDSLFRINHYPPLILTNLKHTTTTTTLDKEEDTSSSPFHHPHHHDHPNDNNNRIGFGEHSDPQILTILRSNDVGGLQISPENGVWVPVSPDPATFCVNVGDVLQAMTNGRFMSVRHRVITNPYKSRMSMAYFGAPPLHATIAAIPELVTQCRPSLYRPFTWSEYKKSAYSLRLRESRLNLFRILEDDEIARSNA
ncbi:Gibberellin 2-beta-dioxygenase 2 [Camellia lanceoleosa]|uniref:Gibberellin 2-beta-dioxygenase 2 n=1 Tax=Camellia lanceoleosa TaxID=1840588 RepID=A0ACC0GUK4_9ERIC|nr:Gibberellin 2-beta-dioxygenase 2 [Camellia lanceoleosa]